jgi:sec-independent protein translocase protein TatA
MDCCFVPTYNVHLSASKPTVMYHTLLLLNFGAPEVIIIGLIVVLLFGGKKIPELMKGLGKGVKNFKDGLKDVEDDLHKDNEKKA